MQWPPNRRDECGGDGVPAETGRTVQPVVLRCGARAVARQPTNQGQASARRLTTRSIRVWSPTLSRCGSCLRQLPTRPAEPGSGCTSSCLLRHVYYSAARPGEALGLREDDCKLPDIGLGRVGVWGVAASGGEAVDGLRGGTRPAGTETPGRQRRAHCPDPSGLVGILRRHLDTTARGRMVGCFAHRTAGWSARRPTTGCGTQARTYAFSRPRLRHRSRVDRMTCGTRRCRCG